MTGFQGACKLIDMGKIYATPKLTVTKPQFTHPFDYKEYEKQTVAYANAVVEWAKQNGKGTEAGKIISFPVADGSAQYVVFSLKPVQLIHLDIYDGYQFNYAHRLTAADVRKRIQSDKAMAKLFGKAS